MHDKDLAKLSSGLVFPTSGSDKTNVDVGTFFGKEIALENSVIRQHLDKPLALEVAAKYHFETGLRKETLNALIPELPDPGRDLYILSNGSGAERKNGSDRGVFDFGTFIPYFVDMLGERVELYVSTWTMNMRGAESMVSLVRDGAVQKLVVCTDPYFNAREPKIAAYLMSALQHEPHAYVAFRNHAKVICAKAGDKVATVTGSANLSSQPRVEQFVVSTSPEVYDFFVTNLFEWAIGQLNNGE